MLYEARVAPHLFLFSNLQRLGFKPDIVLRQMSGGSLQVSSPSFRPTITFQYFHQWRHDQGRTTELHMLVPQLLVGHYSNGSAAESLSAGDFSLQRVGVGAGYRYMRFTQDAVKGLPVRPDHAIEVSLVYQQNVPPMSPELRRSYGDGRSVASLAHEWTHFGSIERPVQREFRLRSQLEATFANGVGPGVTRWSTNASVSMTFRNALGVGPVLRLVNGADYYNIRYAMRFNAISIGVIWEGGVLEYSPTRHKQVSPHGCGCWVGS
jgi:hypothetical protein